MERPPTTRTAHRGVFSPYRYGVRAWEDYVLDTHEIMYHGFESVSAATRESQEASAVLERQFQEEQRLQTELLGDFVARWDALAEDVARLNEGLAALTDQLASGFTQLDLQLRRHAILLETVAGRLDEIATTLRNPLATQACELFRSGRHHLARGLFREAFEDFRDAAAKRPANPLLHLHLAQLHYSVREDGITLSLEEAERHIALAIRYGTHLGTDLGPNAGEPMDLVLRTAADIAIKKGSTLAASGDDERSARQLDIADALLSRSQQSADSRFVSARVAVLRRDRGRALEILGALADQSRLWIARAIQEPDFQVIGSEISGLRDAMRDRPGPGGMAVMHSAAMVLDRSRYLLRLDQQFTGLASTLATAADRIVAEYEAGVAGAVEAAVALQDSLETATRSAIHLATGQRAFALAEQYGHEAESAKLQRAVAYLSSLSRPRPPIPWESLGPTLIGGVILGPFLGMIAEVWGFADNVDRAMGVGAVTTPLALIAIYVLIAVVRFLLDELSRYESLERSRLARVAHERDRHARDEAVKSASALLRALNAKAI